MSRGRYQIMPMLTPDEFDSLRRDIEERGVLVPVEVDEDGNILDGHHRAAIAEDLGIEAPLVLRSGLTEEEKLEHVFALNIARRHLSGHDRTSVIAECRHRGMSLRAIAKVAKVSHETVRSSLADDVSSDLTPELEPFAEPSEPVPAPETRREAIQRLAEEGLSQVAIAAELGIAKSTVSSVTRGRNGQGADHAVDWMTWQGRIRGLEEVASGDSRQIAASVPERNRKSTAKRLRAVGTFLGSIALELEKEV